MESKTLFKVDETSDLPIWVQLRNRFTYLIRTGHFQPGEQLPSVRSLAADAKINYNTVAKAYRELELADLVVMVRGRGMFVSKQAVDDQESELSTVDVLLENCVRQYRTLGMSFNEIRLRIDAYLETKEKEEANENEKRLGYCDVE